MAYFSFVMCPCNFRLTLRQSRPNKASFKCMSIRTQVHMYVHAYVCPSTKSVIDFNEISHVDIGQ